MTAVVKPEPASASDAELTPNGALPHLTEEEIRTWSLEEKDRWWLYNVYRGDMPQLTLRSGLTGMLLGGILSLTNLYVGAKTGWTLGVGITSVILAFAAFRVANQLKLVKTEFSLLENNCMQSIATSAGYMTMPLVSSLAAYMMVTGKVVPMGVIMVWMILLSILGVLFAFPLKRRFINDEQLPFPEGRAAGVVLHALHSGDAREGLYKGKLLLVTASLAAVLSVMKSHTLMERMKLGFLAIPDYVDGWVHRWLWDPKVLGIPLRELTVRVETDFVMMAAGGLMGIRTGVSLLVGGLINYAILVPWMIERGDIQGITTENGIVYPFKTLTIWAPMGGSSDDDDVGPHQLLCKTRGPRLVVRPDVSAKGYRRIRSARAHRAPHEGLRHRDPGDRRRGRGPGLRVLRSADRDGTDRDPARVRLLVDLGELYRAHVDHAELRARKAHASDLRRARAG
ncbi:MAG: hypothetical protein HC923_00035 [Myxococcales bacterium]|nr:hypothetical protein [Myxococcales bacterium]